MFVVKKSAPCARTSTGYTHFYTEEVGGVRYWARPASAEIGLSGSVVAYDSGSAGRDPGRPVMCGELKRMNGSYAAWEFSAQHEGSEMP